MVAALVLGMGRGAEDGMLLGVVSPILALFFLGITVVLLIADLKQPWRFYYLITKPNFRSWLVWGTYILMIYGGLATAWLVCGWLPVRFRRAHGRDGDFRDRLRVLLRFSVRASQGARSVAESGLHLASIGAGVDRRRGALIIAAMLFGAGPATILAAARVLLAALTVGLVMILIELTLPAMSEDFRRAADLISRGELSFRFWIGVVLIGTIVPLILLGTTLRAGAAARRRRRRRDARVGRTVDFENLWIEAGQAVPLS